MANPRHVLFPASRKAESLTWFYFPSTILEPLVTAASQTCRQQPASERFVRNIQNLACGWMLGCQRRTEAFAGPSESCLLGVGRLMRFPLERWEQTIDAASDCRSGAAAPG